MALVPKWAGVFAAVRAMLFHRQTNYVKNMTPFSTRNLTDKREKTYLYKVLISFKMCD
jgi:hypothetical protein